MFTANLLGTCVPKNAPRLDSCPRVTRAPPGGHRRSREIPGGAPGNDFYDFLMEKNKIGLERVAIMAALNLSHEVLSLQGGRAPRRLDDHEDRLKVLTSKLDEALYQLRQLEIN